MIRWIVSLWSDYLWILFESYLNSFMHDYYSFVFLSNLLIWFGPLDWLFLQLEGCFVMGSILRCSIPVTEGYMTRIVLLLLRIKIWGLFMHEFTLSTSTCELRWDFPEEEGMMQYSRDKYFPQLWNQGYQSSRRITQQLFSSTCTPDNKYLHPTWTRGCQSLSDYLQIKFCSGR